MSELPTNQVLQGDNREVLATWPENCIDTIITDPPYHLTQVSRRGSPRKEGTGPFSRIHVGERGFMGKTWDGGGVAFDPETWAGILRVAKPGAILLAFGGTRTWHRLACAIEDAGWIIDDTIMWLYGSGWPKGLDLSKGIDKAAGAEREVVGKDQYANRGAGINGTTFKMQNSTAERRGDITVPATDAAKLWQGYNTAIKPAFEPIIVAMKPLEGTYVENALKYGVAGFNIDRARIPAEPELARNWDRTQSEVMAQDRATYGKFGVIDLRGRAPSGRWPPNVAMDEEAAAMLDEQAGTRKAGGAPARRFSPLTKNCYGEYGMDCPGGIGPSEGGPSRFFYTSKAPQAERYFYCTDCQGAFVPAEREDHRHGHINSEGKPTWTHLHSHPTVKSQDLMEWLVRLTKPPAGGIVLDPFCGSGSTLVACLTEDRDFIGIDNDPESCAIARARLKDAQQPLPLFGESA